MENNNDKLNKENDTDMMEDFLIDLRQFIHIGVDKEKFKDELDGINDYNNIYG